MNSDKKAEQDIMSMLSKAMEGKIYGSIEIYLENGSITQVSQRIIKKIVRQKQTIKNYPHKKLNIKTSRTIEETSAEFHQN